MYFWKLLTTLCSLLGICAQLNTLSERIIKLPENDTDLILLTVDSDSILFGGKNIIRSYSIVTLEENLPLIWAPTAFDQITCKKNGKPDNLCHNFIRIFRVQNEYSHPNMTSEKRKLIFVCGTNAFRPKCRTYAFDGKTYTIIKEHHAYGLCAADPRQPVKYTFGAANGDLYVATLAGVSSNDPLISRPLSNLRTQRVDNTFFNDPTFFGALSLKGLLFFLFTETPMESQDKKVTRLARICENDNGGRGPLKSQFTSFLKTTLQCPIVLNDFQSFYMKNISIVSNAEVATVDSSKINVVFVVFVENYKIANKTFLLSVVCLFDLNGHNYKRLGWGSNRPGSLQKEIRFEDEISDYVNPQELNNRRSYAHLIKDPEKEFSWTHQCPNLSNASDAIHYFYRDHPLTAKPLFDKMSENKHEPFITMLNDTVHITAIHVHYVHYDYFDSIRAVVYTGTSDGRVRATFDPFYFVSKREKQTTVMFDLQIFPTQSAIHEIFVKKDNCSNDTLLVISSNEVKLFQLYGCKELDACPKCTSKGHPYCHWNVTGNICQPSCGVVSLKGNLVFFPEYCDQN